jgi:peptide/nickel transport system substrate-binding protein
MKKKTLSFLLAVSCALSLLLSGCGQNQQPAPDDTQPGVQDQQPEQTPEPTLREPEIDQTREIVFAASRDQCPGEQDGHYASMTLGVWEPLITKDEDGRPAPALATSWEPNEDSTVWTFHLREGVNFSNGIPFNADVVLANFDRMKKGPFSSSFYSVNIDTTYPGLLSCEKTDDYTVVLTFESPLPLQDYTMANYGSSMFEPSCFAEDGNFNGFAIGTGPYVVTENVLGQYCVIERNENYWGTPGIAKTFRFKVIPDAETRYTALRAGEVQGLCDLGAISPALAAEIADDPAYSVSVGDSGINHFLNVNGGSFPFNDVRMKQGLSLLLDRQTIVDSFYNGYGIPAGGFLNYTSPFYEEQPVQYDPEKGMELIREVVGDQAVELRFLLPTVDANRYPYQEEAEYIQALLENIEGTNIKVNIELMDWGPCKDEMAAGNYSMCLKIQGLPSANPFSLFNGWMHTGGSTNTGYGLSYENARADALIDEAAASTDADRIAEIYVELQRISAEDFPTIPVLYSEEVVASSSDITGYEARIYGLTGYTQVCWAK